MEEQVVFEIFEPDGKKFHLTPNWLMLFLWLPTMASLYCLSNNILIQYKVEVLIWIISVFAIYLFFSISSYFTYMPLFGVLKGEIEFKNDAVTVNDKAIKLSEINNINFTINDFYGQRSTAWHSFNPKYSLGIDNYFTYTDNLNQAHIIYFKLATEHHYESLSPFIEEAIKSKKMSRRSI